jgi:hypothetical protein
MFSIFGQCGLDTAKASPEEVDVVANIDHPEKFSFLNISESSMYSASTLHPHNLPYDYASLRLVEPPDTCLVCFTTLTDFLRPEPLHKWLFSWQSQLRRCGRDGRRTHVHEVVKLVVKRLTLCNPDPGGTAIHPYQPILEANHLRSDASRKKME